MPSPFDIQFIQTVAQLNKNGNTYAKYNDLVENEKLIEPCMQAFLDTNTENRATRRDLLHEIQRLIKRLHWRENELLLDLVPMMGEQLNEKSNNRIDLSIQEHSNHMTELMAAYNAPYPTFNKELYY